MITAMNKLDLLLFQGEQAAFLDALRDVGVVHIVEHREALSKKGRALQVELAAIDKLLAVLKKGTPQTANDSSEGKELVAQIQAHIQELEDCRSEIEEFKKTSISLKPWGDINQEKLQELADKGIYITLFEVSHKLDHLLENYLFEVIEERKTSRKVAVITEGEPAVIAGLEAFILPDYSLSQMESMLVELRETSMVLEKQLAELATHRQTIEAYRETQLEAFLLEKAHCSMQSAIEGQVLHLQGWLPAKEKERVAHYLDGFSCWYEIVEPTQEDVVPVELANKGGAKLFEPITKIFALPDYFEIDPTPFFAPFYALFFGLCLGDVGYGLLLMTLSLVMIKMAPKAAGIGVLGLILGFTTTFSGVLLNSVFGAPLFATADQTTFAFLGATHNGFALLQPVVDTSTGSTIFPAMAFSIFIGLLQIILGMIIKAVNKVRTNGSFVYAIYPIGTIILTLASTVALIKINFLDMAKFFEITMDIPMATVQAAMTQEILMGLLTVGLVLLFFFNNPEKKITTRLPLGLWELYGFSTALMGDALSYIRLFALGLAGGLLGNAFNGIAFMISADGPSVLMVVTILILVLGHIINFALSVLGSFVHPLRLTFVEFYKNIDFKGGAPAYVPYKSQKKTV